MCSNNRCPARGHEARAAKSVVNLHEDAWPPPPRDADHVNAPIIMDRADRARGQDCAELRGDSRWVQQGGKEHLRPVWRQDRTNNPPRAHQPRSSRRSARFVPLPHP